MKPVTAEYALGYVAQAAYRAQQALERDDVEDARQYLGRILKMEKKYEEENPEL